MAEWTYCRILNVPTEKIPGRVPASVLVAYKPIEGVGADPLNRAYGWIRMVVWIPEGYEVKAHVNISSNELYEVVKARLQGFDDGQSIYLIDYAGAERGGPGAEDAFETRPGREPWKDSVITPPSILTVEDQALRTKRMKVPAP